MFQLIKHKINLQLIKQYNKIKVSKLKYKKKRKKLKKEIKRFNKILGNGIN